MKKIILLPLLFACAVSAEPGPLDFLDRADSDVVWVLDSGLDPTPFIGPLNPPYEVGQNALTRLDLATGEITASIPLGSSGPVLAFELSPDGDTAIAARIFDNALLVIDGLASPETVTIHEYPLPLQPLSLAFSSDGRRAAIGYQTGAGEAYVALVDRMDSSDPSIQDPVGLGISADYLTAVEAIDFSLDGSRLVTQTAMHDVAPPDPAYFMPRVALQSSAVWADGIAVGPAFEPGRQSILPPAPPFSGAPTGVALGDFALTCDGLTALVPVSGALDIGQPDARILVVDGINTGHLVLRKTLTPADGVDVAPLQVALSADCERALVTNAFAGTMTHLTGVREGDFALTGNPLLMPFPSEPAISADSRYIVIQHPRPPLDGVPPSNVTVYDGGTLTPALAPIFGPVRSWLQAKDRTLAVWPAGLLDRVDAAGLPTWMSRMYERRIDSAMDAVHKGNLRRAQYSLRITLWLTFWLDRSGHLDEADADMFSSYLRNALYALADAG
ncbi:MAG: hypothetical protein QNI99_11310 [Woeseiaceae bacterium]|nr:hypothetical protein [Woeseiaceae bacterium]